MRTKRRSASAKRISIIIRLEKDLLNIFVRDNKRTQNASNGLLQT